jgi:1-acyl-sn-glycerol-3-phosphate acyltransferase
VGRFKTGAVRIAQQAGVPVVPIVLHNSGALMARDSAAVRPGVARVSVLPPVDVEGDPRVESDRLRDLFVAELRRV